MTKKLDIRKIREAIAPLAEKYPHDLRYFLAAAVLGYEPIRRSRIPEELRPLYQYACNFRFKPGHTPVSGRARNSDDEYAVVDMAKLMIKAEMQAKPTLGIDRAAENVIRGKGVMAMLTAAKLAIDMAPHDLKLTSPQTLVNKFKEDPEYYTTRAAEEILWPLPQLAILRHERIGCWLCPCRDGRSIAKAGTAEQGKIVSGAGVGSPESRWAVISAVDTLTEMLIHPIQPCAPTT